MTKTITLTVEIEVEVKQGKYTEAVLNRAPEDCSPAEKDDDEHEVTCVDVIYEGVRLPIGEQDKLSEYIEDMINDHDLEADEDFTGE